MPTVVPTVCNARPNEPAAPDVYGWSGWTLLGSVVALVGKALGSVALIPARLVWLKMLKISIRTSPLGPLLGPIRLATTASTCQKFGPWIELRSRLPFVPGFGVVNAAGLRKSSPPSLINGLTPGTRLGRRTFREAPPPGVLTTAVRSAAWVRNTVPEPST